MREATRGSRTFWWDRARPAEADVDPLRAVIFNLDGALADIERDGHRVAFNTAFAAHGLDVGWDVEDYGQLLRIGDEHRRVAFDLRRRGFGNQAATLATQIQATKSAVLGDCLLDGDIAPRPGLIDSVMSLFVAGVWVGVVANGRRAWVEPLVRELIGDGIAETIVTRDDLAEPASECDGYALALWEFGIDPQSALAVEGSAAGLRAATAVGLATVVVTTDYTARQDFTGAAGVRSAYDGADPLLASSCERLHGRWWTAKKRSAAA